MFSLFDLESEPAFIESKILLGRNITKGKPPITNFICPILLYGNHAATGIFLSKSHVLTEATFLLIKINSQYIQVEKDDLMVAMIYSKNARETVQVEDFHIHKDFNPRILDRRYNIAILIVGYIIWKIHYIVPTWYSMSLNVVQFEIFYFSETKRRVI